jgi:hypothetical protein
MSKTIAHFLLDLLCEESVNGGQEVQEKPRLIGSSKIHILSACSSNGEVRC